MHPPLATLLADGFGVLDRRLHPELRHQIDHAVRSGVLVRVLPNTYCAAGGQNSLRTRARAACLADPDAVITGLAAGVIGGWKELPEPPVPSVATPHQHPGWSGVRLERRSVPRSHTRVVEGIRITTFPMTAVDLALSEGPPRLDDALRRGIELLKIREALEATPRRPGYGRLRRELRDVRDKPWSRLECAAHVLLRQAGITGWRANRAIRASPEELVGYGDLVFDDLWLVIELDGKGDHSELWQRTRDKARDLRLARLGWEVVRLSGDVVFKTPAEFIAIVRDLLRTRARRLGPAGLTLEAPAARSRRREG